MNEFVAQKNYIRARIKHERQALTSPFMQRSAIALLGHVSQSQLIEEHDNIAFYLPTGGEISCLPIIEYALSQGKKCFVPKIVSTKKREMLFLPYSGSDSVEKGQFGIPEPIADHSEAVKPTDLSLVFMPLVAFDKDGNRLGMGGGYYDTTFADVSQNQTGNPLLVGLAYNLQKVPQVPTDKWDLQMDAVITPNNYHRFPKE
ncbi:5-formyltetrahydrofolate cyclo-ligase [Kangiella sediminilitoris]|uniref:5-formyltetrahydrofolate cyclo-ligase n=1 Tax=Kangiella sediminilitoris TaxID=1144748 RepID=UPI00083E5EF9|nr:5-formyltetrahydrofolate cyclo-ligase [Kangiella sediminilitoris]